MGFSKTLHTVMCNMLPENITNKIYKDVHEISYSNVMLDVLKLNHKKEYTFVLGELEDKKMYALVEHMTSLDMVNGSIEGQIHQQEYEMQHAIVEYIDMVEGRYSEHYSTADINNKLNEIHSYDLFDFSFDDALELAFDAIDERQSDTESEEEEYEEEEEEEDDDGDLGEVDYESDDDYMV
jgi:hypothetical protein